MQRQTYSFTATLAPQAGTAGLLRIVSILHSRDVHVHQLTHSADSRSRAVVTACVTSGNAARAAVESALRRAVDVMEVSTRLVHPGEPALTAT